MKIYGRCKVLSWPDFDNNVHALPEQIIKHCSCPGFAKDGLPCMHMYLIAFYSKAIKINRFLHYLK